MPFGAGLEIGFIPPPTLEAETAGGDQPNQSSRMAMGAIFQSGITNLLQGFKSMTTFPALILIYRHKLTELPCNQHS